MKTPEHSDLQAESTRDQRLRRAHERRRWGRLVLALSVLSIALASGCTPFRGLREQLQYNDGMNDFVLGWRNSVWARQAWEERKHLHAHEPQFVAFGQGFRDGYADVAGGGSGCVPPLPPRSYWTWKYQTGEGQAKVAAWFAGYPYGAKAAQEDGAGNFQQIQVSHLIEQQYSPEFLSGHCPGCDPTTLPHGPAMEVIPAPGANPGVPAGPLVPAAPAAVPPLQNPTTQPASDPTWTREPLTRIPAVNAPAAAPFSQVIPASALMPVE